MLKLNITGGFLLLLILWRFLFSVTPRPVFHSTITLIENFAHSVSLTFLPAMFAPVKAAGARRGINLRLERGKGCEI